MADENGVKTPPEEPKEPQEPKQEPEPDTGQQEPEEPVLDKHGQVGINKERHDKEVGELKATIKQLQEQLDEQAKTQAGREEMGKKIAELEKKLEEEAVNHQLEMARCRNLKAARALLEDHEGDVSKLKAAEPWLFETDTPTGSTGLKPTGAAQSEAEIDARLRKAAGLKERG